MVGKKRSKSLNEIRRSSEIRERWEPKKNLIFECWQKREKVCLVLKCSLRTSLCSRLSVTYENHYRFRATFKRLIFMFAHETFLKQKVYYFFVSFKQKTFSHPSLPLIYMSKHILQPNKIICDASSHFKGSEICVKNGISTSRELPNALPSTTSCLAIFSMKREKLRCVRWMGESVTMWEIQIGSSDSWGRIWHCLLNNV